MLDFRESRSPEDNERKKTKDKRSFLSIYWKCCYTYSHIYKSPTGKTYTGRCPKCGACVTVPIGTKGTHQRMFIAE